MDIEKPNCIGCPHIHPDNGNCTAVGGFCTAVPAAHCPLIPELRAENEKLRTELEQVKRERDAAVDDFRRIGSEGLCSICDHLNAPDLYCADCKGTAHIVTDMFEWRGPQREA